MEGALEPVPAGEVATIVTYLAMTRRPLPRPLPPGPFRLVRWDRPDPDRYRALFRRIGEPWLWFSRLAMVDTELVGIIADPAVSVHAVVDAAGIEIGLLELDRRDAGETRIAYLGLIPELAGKGHGRWLMAHALALAWGRETRAVTVHTCTLDHPAALGFYRREGFIPQARAVERFPDPRLTGLLPRDAASHVPLLG